MQQTERSTSGSFPVLGADGAEREAFECRIRELERENQTKAEFLALVSHELRTPLNSIIGYTELLLSGIPVQLPENARHHVERIRSSTMHQVKLVNEIIRYAKFESSASRSKREPFPLQPLVDDVVSLTIPAAEQKGLQLHVQQVQSLIVYTDETRVRQILLNLVWNAIKFTNSGMIEVSVKASKDCFTVSVSDSGIGIPADMIDRVFEPFWRAERTAGLEDGAGLGLTVSRTLARSLGGDLTVTSQVGTGSVFTLLVHCRIHIHTDGHSAGRVDSQANEFGDGDGVSGN
jgi:signal transduction histidine kinase